MGRYYSGDIEGKFMFAVQPSSAGERFGAQEYTGHIQYYVDREEYDNIVEELNKIESTGVIKRVKDMFDVEVGWSDRILEKHNVSQEDLSEYADWRMGKQIKEFFDENPEEMYCNFTAET